MSTRLDEFIGSLEVKLQQDKIRTDALNMSDKYVRADLLVLVFTMIVDK